MGNSEQTLDQVLGQFERVDSNLQKLEKIWAEMQLADAARQGQLVTTFENLLPGLPAIDGFRVTAVPIGQTEAQLQRFEAAEVGEPSVHAAVEQEIDAPGREIAHYRVLFDQTRRIVIRDRVSEVVGEIDFLVGPSGSLVGENTAASGDWDRLVARVAELDRLVGGSASGTARWNDLHRHIHFGTDVDLNDIIQMDWPSVRSEVESNLYDDTEPLPVSVDDLGEMARARPTGPVSTRLPWNLLSPEDFEGLLFELIRTADGYENTNWLMKTEAPDRGRDIETYRVINDVLGGTQRRRVIVQCKHWTTRSISVPDLVTCIETVRLWEPPGVDVLVVATSGRFTQDAVALIEKKRNERSVPSLEPWSNSHIETLLARRPGIAVKFGLR